MLSSRYIFKNCLFLLFCLLTISSFAQLGISFDIKKPKEYDERVLRSEKSDQKKFTLPRRFIQNTVTHYNYYFNANNKLNEVIERAKGSFKDDYSELLPFYNYTLETTQLDSVQLDSITYKSSTGIALHDLRNDWADNLYLLWGAAFYLRKDFDSAFLMFQFINYAFAEKEKDGYYKTIGSNQDGNSALSIATKEKNSLPRRIFSEPPSRNDAFIWQIRNFLAQDQFPEAASLIITLRNDPVFPSRLKNDLEEVQAYWFYKQNMWDSAAFHLVNALDNATNKQERARWEYLLAQLYELTGDYKESQKYYAKVINHTVDPVMDVYARLYSVRVNKDDGEKDIDRNIAELLKMAHRDKYQDYRDIIYYMAAQLELERKNPDAALPLLLKSTQYPSNDVSQRNKAFIQMAEISFTQKKYRLAYNFYDSLRLDDPALKNIDEITDKKEMLGRLANNIEIVARQDSLQRIAKLPDDERKDFVKKMVRQLRKQQGLKDEGVLTTGSPFTAKNAPTLFPSTDTKGEWYFYNAASKTRGQAEFRGKWGNRPNVDNWRRSAAIVAGAQNNRTNSQGFNVNNLVNNTSTDNTPEEITYENLLGKLPITADQLQKSNDSIQSALYDLGKIYIQEAEKCEEGTETYEELRTRFPEFDKMDEVLFNLYYCYNKNGETAKAAAIKKLMGEKNAGSNFTAIINTGKDPKASLNNSATAAYEKVYDLFIEGSFEQAVAEKKIADSLYGKNYWTPQLLYIESVYYIKQREDSIAKDILKNIISQFPQSPLAGKATTMLDVLSRRAQIEEELRNLVVTRPPEDTVSHQPITTVINPPKDTVSNKPAPVVIKPTVTDTVAIQPQKNVGASFAFTPDAPHYVLLLLNKVDPVFSNEAKNAYFRYNRETFYNKQMTVELIELDGENRLLLISPFKNAQEAMDYIDKTKPKTATEIIPWLKGGKYTYSIITDKNLDVLKANKDLETYKMFLNQNMPGKF